MAWTIWKFPLEVTDEQVIEVPQGAALLSCQVQSGTPCLWALVDDSAPRVKRRIRIHGTGHPVAGVDHLSFVDTFHLHGGQLVFHVFEEDGA